MSDLFPSKFLNENSYYDLYYFLDELLNLVKDDNNEIDCEEMSEYQEKMELEVENINTKRKLDSKVNFIHIKN